VRSAKLPDVSPMAMDAALLHVVQTMDATDTRAPDRT
jgi:hypothetical protein